MGILFTVFVALILIAVLYFLFRKKTPLPQPDVNMENLLLTDQVVFYKQLNDPGKEEFIQRARFFLSTVKITGVETTVEDLDRILIAAAAVIPVFNIKNWRYSNISEILLYPHSFSSDFDLLGNNRNILGEVGAGPLQGVMILSKPDLRNGFLQHGTPSNTGIHEFAHLIDKTDGATDGVPEVLLERTDRQPWLDQIHQEMDLIRKGKSDINPYALTNEAEFFAVVSEYFFNQPTLMHTKHPELFSKLEHIYRTKEKKRP